METKSSVLCFILILFSIMLLVNGDAVDANDEALLSPVLAPSTAPNFESRKGKSVAIIISASLISFLAVAFFVALLFIWFSRKKHSECSPEKLEKGELSTSQNKADTNNQFTFLEGFSCTFTLDDVLRFSEFVKGTFGFTFTYDVAIKDHGTVVIKSLENVSCGKHDFEQRMEIVGGIRHENVVALKGYYYSDFLKLMMYEYNCLGSVEDMLHRRGDQCVFLDWSTRIRIALGAARGIVCIHSMSCGEFVHGNIKSSNIFLNKERYGCVSDVGLATITSPLAPSVSHPCGYHATIASPLAPEISDTTKVTQPSDVYSFGVVLLELLTGKPPIQTTASGEVIDLVSWVHAVIQDQCRTAIFDKALMMYPIEEMNEMLQIALSCVSKIPDGRPKMKEVVKSIEAAMKDRYRRGDFSII